MYLVHGYSYRLVRFPADRTEAHRSRDKAAHDRFFRLYLLQGDRGALFEGQEVTQEYGAFLLINHMGIFLEFLVAPQAGSQLKHGNGVRVPSVFLAILAEGINAFMFQ